MTIFSPIFNDTFIPGFTMAVGALRRGGKEHHIKKILQGHHGDLQMKFHDHFFVIP